MAIKANYPPTQKICGFCSHWYDPTNSVIAPVTASRAWSVVTQTKKPCLKKNRVLVDVLSGGGCVHFECKL